MGWSNSNISHTQKHIHKEVEPEPQGHGLSVETLKQLPELLERPAAVFNSLTKSNA
ncbi:MuF-C-terminal domain-containing protein [Arcanobacterium phocae]